MARDEKKWKETQMWKMFPKIEFKIFVFFKSFALLLGGIVYLSGSWQCGWGTISAGSDNLPQQVASQLVDEIVARQPQYAEFSTDVLLAADWGHCGTGYVKTDSH